MPSAGFAVGGLRRAGRHRGGGRAAVPAQSLSRVRASADHAACARGGRRSGLARGSARLGAWPPEPPGKPERRRRSSTSTGTAVLAAPPLRPADAPRAARAPRLVGVCVLLGHWLRRTHPTPGGSSAARAVVSTFQRNRTCCNLVHGLVHTHDDASPRGPPPTCCTRATSASCPLGGTAGDASPRPLAPGSLRAAVVGARASWARRCAPPLLGCASRAHWRLRLKGQGARVRRRRPRRAAAVDTGADGRRDAGGAWPGRPPRSAAGVSAAAAAPSRGGGCGSCSARCLTAAAAAAAAARGQLFAVIAEPVGALWSAFAEGRRDSGAVDDDELALSIARRPQPATSPRACRPRRAGVPRPSPAPSRGVGEAALAGEAPEEGRAPPPSPWSARSRSRRRRHVSATCPRRYARGSPACSRPRDARAQRPRPTPGG